MLGVRDLEMLVAISDEGTVTAAAHRLAITQPALTRRLRSLESRLDLQLFVRQHRGMVATPTGERLLETARPVLHELSGAIREAGQLRAGAAGTIRITTECYTCYHWLPGILKIFRRSLPEMELRLVPQASTRAVEALLQGEIDLAIVDRAPGDSRIKTTGLFRDELVAIVPAGHPWERQAYVRPGDFRKVRLILHTDPEESTLYAEVLRPNDVEPLSVDNLRLSGAVLESIRAGLGVTVMPRWAVAPVLERNELAAKRVTKPGLWRHWHAAQRRRRIPWQPLDDLTDLLRDRTLLMDAGTHRRTASGPSDGDLTSAIDSVTP